MEFFRAFKKPIAAVGLVFFTLTVLLAHDVSFHIHSLSHDSASAHEHHSLSLEAGHVDVALKHLSNDMSHADHHHGVVIELSATPSGVLQSFSIDPSSIDLVLILVLVIAGGIATTGITTRHPYTPSTQPRRYYLVPALRAPPR